MKKLFVLSAGMAVALMAQAQMTPGGYATLGAGVSKYNESCEGVSNCDTTGTGLKFSAGYGMANGLAIEGVAINFGKAKASDGGLQVELKSNAIGLGGAYAMPVSKDLAFLLRLGVARVKTTGTVVGIGSVSDTGTSPYFGLALTWNLNPTTYVEFGWDSTQAKFEGEKENVSLLSVGLGLRF